MWPASMHGDGAASLGGAAPIGFGREAMAIT